MNNFEKRTFLDYLDKLLNHIDVRSYEFDSVLEFFLFQFRVKRSNFKFDEDNVVLTETRLQQTDLRKKLKVIVLERSLLWRFCNS